MTEQLKTIVQALNKEPYNKNLNLITFDSLEPNQLIQILNDIFSDIDPKQKVDIREESPDQTTIRMLGMLKVLKYNAEGMSNFRSGLVQGEKHIIYPILEWLLQRAPELRKRAYLARYLVKVELPTEISQDEQVMEIYTQYCDLIEQFKLHHKELVGLQSSGNSTSEIRKDISNMEDEKEQLLKRIERLKRKVESHPNSQAMMTVAKNLRLQRDREKKLTDQRNEQSTSIQHGEHRFKRLQLQLKDIRQASVGTSPEGLLKKLQEETRANGYIVKESLPKEIQTKRKLVQDLQKVVAEPAMGQSDLEELQMKIQDTSAEVNQLIEKRLRSNDPIDDKLSLFKQQAAIIVRKKEAAAESLREAHDDYSRVQHELEEKRGLAMKNDGGEVLKGEDFKHYVNKLRGKSNVYKKKRQEMAGLRAEIGVLSRTEEVLKSRDDSINQQLSTLEIKKGVSGYRQTQDDLEKVSAVKSGLDEVKGKTLDDISDMVRRLTNTIAEKKNALAPVIKELRPLRQRNQELTAEYEQKKSAYDMCNAGLESNRSKLEQEVRGYQLECAAEESRYHYLQNMMKMINLQQKKVDDEIRAYMSSDPQVKKKTFRDLYSRKIQEQENLGKSLRDKQKTVRENQEPSIKQMSLWRDFERIMECKTSLSHQYPGHKGDNSLGYGEAPPAFHEEDRLVL